MTIRKPSPCNPNITWRLRHNIIVKKERWKEKKGEVKFIEHLTEIAEKTYKFLFGHAMLQRVKARARSYSTS